MIATMTTVNKLFRIAVLLISVALLVSSSLVIVSIGERPWFRNSVGNLYLLSAIITIFVISSFSWLKPASPFGKVVRILFALLFAGILVTSIAGLLPQGDPSAGGLALIGLGALALIICPIGLVTL